MSRRPKALEPAEFTGNADGDDRPSRGAPGNDSLARAIPELGGRVTGNGLFPYFPSQPHILSVNGVYAAR